MLPARPQWQMVLVINVKFTLSLLKCLVQNQCSSAMVENYVLVIKASFILYELPFVVFEHPKIKYFIKSPLTLKTHNLIDLSMLRGI